MLLSACLYTVSLSLFFSSWYISSLSFFLWNLYRDARYRYKSFLFLFIQRNMSNTTPTPTPTTTQLETLQSLIDAERSYLDNLQLIDSVYMDLQCCVSLSNIRTRNCLHSGWSNCNLLRLISVNCSSAFKILFQSISHFMMYSLFHVIMI